MKILITGGAGFIGSHLTQLLSVDHEVIIYDIQEPKQKNVDFIIGDVNDAQKNLESCKDIDIVIRITGDDILRDEIMIDKAVTSHLNQSCDVTLTRNMPYGCATEIFTVKTLETIIKKANCPENTGYLEWYLDNDKYFSINDQINQIIIHPFFQKNLRCDASLTNNVSKARADFSHNSCHQTC